MNGNGEMPAQAARFGRRALWVGVVGLAACAAGAILDPPQFFRSYLWAYWLWLGVAIGCGQVLMLQFLVTSHWGFLIRRILEAGTRTLLPMYVLSIPLLIGISSLYPFAQPEYVARSGGLQHKTLYLNVPFFLARLAVYFLVWWVIARLLNRWSLEEDRTGDPSYLLRCRSLSGPGIVLYTLAVTFASIDWVMSLEPEWYSTVYPLVYVVGQVLSALALAILAARYLAAHKPLSETATPKHFHDLGNLLLTFVVLWAYIAAAQLIIIWSANLPREVTWYLHRTAGGWLWVSAALAVFHFFVPFFILLSRRAKLKAERLARIAVFVLFMRVVDYFWLVEPAFHTEAFYIHWLDVAAPAGIGGIWVALLARELGKRPLAPRYAFGLEKALERA